LYKFTQDGYNSIPETDIRDIPPRLEGFDHFQAACLVQLKRIGTSIDVFFEKYGLGFLPSVARYILASATLLSPVVAVFVFLAFGEFENEAEQRKYNAQVNQGEKSSKRAPEKKKEEKKKDD
jgi:hypothetical protein